MPADPVVPPASHEPVIEIVDRPDAERFVATVDGEIAGFATYRLRRDVITFIHTEVAPAFGGHGLGVRIVVHALDDARRRGLRVRPLCPLFAKYIEEHAEYRDLLVTQAAP